MDFFGGYLTIHGVSFLMISVIAIAALGYVLPDGIDRTEENYKREILKLRIENERLKKNYTVKTLENGEQVYVHLKPKITK